MSKEHEAYWLKRSLQDSSKAYNFTEKQLRILKKEYQKAIKTIKDMLLSAKETERLESLKDRIEQEVDRLFTLERALTKDTLITTYEEGYYRSVFNIQQALGYGTAAVYIAPRVAEQVINTAWSGKNYSHRIWTHRKRLGKKVEQIITQGTILGYSNAKMGKQLADDMNVSFNQAARLIRTETNYVYNQATKAGYEAMGQDSYIFLATLDMRTSEQCQSLDGKKFKLKDAQAGVNYPPMHPNCRSTTIPDVEEDENEVRLAKLNGEYYEVPASMTYDQWYKEHVVSRYGQEKAASMKKMALNETRDRKRYAAYKAVLGIDVPKSFAAFQSVKYNQSEAWGAIQRQYRTFNKINAGSYTDAYKRKLKSTYRYFKNEGHEFTIHALNRTIGQKTGKGKTPFTKEDIKAILKKPHNFVQSNGHLVRFESNIAIIQAQDTKEIVSVVSIKKPKSNWKEE